MKEIIFGFIKMPLREKYWVTVELLIFFYEVWKWFNFFSDRYSLDEYLVERGFEDLKVR